MLEAQQGSVLNPKCSLPQLPGQDKSHTSCGSSVYKGSPGQELFNHPEDLGSKFITTTTPSSILIPWFSVRCQELFITYRNPRGRQQVHLHSGRRYGLHLNVEIANLWWLAESVVFRAPPAS